MLEEEVLKLKVCLCMISRLQTDWAKNLCQASFVAKIANSVIFS